GRRATGTAARGGPLAGRVGDADRPAARGRRRREPRPADGDRPARARRPDADQPRAGRRVGQGGGTRVRRRVRRPGAGRAPRRTRRGGRPMTPVALHHVSDGPTGAPPLLLGGSLGSTVEMWRPQLPALAEHHRVIRYDHRGHGGSPVPPGPYTVE